MRSDGATFRSGCARFLMCAPSADELWDQIDRGDPARVVDRAISAPNGDYLRFSCPSGFGR
jgi:hypothetical protein